MNFTKEEKLRLFDKIESLYFRRNFGSTSKADLETLLFSEYIECCLEQKQPFDDYTISKALGITQARVRTLKERKELKYPHNEDNDGWWKESFINAAKNAKYDEKDHYIKFIIEDVNVMNEARHFIEESGWYDECSLNRKLLRIPLDCFTEICLEDEVVAELFTESEKRKLQELAKDNPDITEFLKDFSKDGLKAFLMSASKEAILLVLQTLPFGGMAEGAFRFLEKAVKHL